METRNPGLNYWQRLRRSYAWRLPATGLGFAAFGMGAALLSVSVFPLMYFLPIQQVRKEQTTRRVIAWMFRHYIRFLELLGLLTYELHNVELLRRPNQLILVNHPSLLDVVFIIALTSNTSCVVKGNLWRNPFTIMAMRAGNYVSNSHSELFQSCVDTLKNGSSLIIFPEGTRSRPGEPLSFHRGPSNIALSVGKAITPVVITCKPATLLKHQKWYQISPSPPHFTIRVMPAFATAHYMAEGQLQSTAARQLTRDLVEYFTQHIENQSQS
ncbi:MAG TPA: lysophospholipid acyltransferase family protein [Cellvibrio sp.]|nr:lysophospholipid acyltransferase family protein [Cellvibrio sp.]